MKRIVIMGSTGSVGTQALDIIRHHRDKFKNEPINLYRLNKPTFSDDFRKHAI